MKRIKLIVALGAILVLILVLTFCASISDEDVFAMERRGNVLELRNDTATVSYNLDKVKYLSYSQSGNGEDAFICSDPEVMEGLFSAMFEAPITMERLGEAGAIGTSGAYPGILLEREVTFSFVMEDGTALRWIIGLDGALCLVTDECIYLSPSRSIDYTAVSPHLTWFVVTHRDANGNRYDVSADGKTFLYYYPGNPAESFEIPEGIEVVAEKSFCDVKDLKELTFSSTVKTIEGEFFYDIPFERVVIPETVENVLYYIKGANLKELVCAAPMTEFHYVSGPKLERLTLPSTIKEYGAWAFGEQLPALQAIKVYGGEVVLDEAFEAFSKDRVIYIPEGATSFCLDQFTGLSHDTYVYLPDSCETFLVDPGVYLAGAVFTISVPADAQVISNDRYPVSNVRIWRRGTENSSYRVTLEDGAGNRYDLSNDGKTLVYYHKENTGTVFEVPRGVEAVLSGAFADIPCLKELSFANTVKGIGNIFYTGIPLEKITLPSSLTQFASANLTIQSSSLKSLSLRCNVGSLTLKGCTSLETLWLNNLPLISGEYRMKLDGCDHLRGIYISGEAMHDASFEEFCSAVNEYPVLYLPEGAEIVESGFITSKVNLYVPDSVTWVSYDVLQNGCSDAVVSLPAHASIVGATGEEALLSAGTVVRRGEISKELRRQIEDDWCLFYGYNLTWFDVSEIVTRHYGLRDYGTYNGYTVLFCPKPRVLDDKYSDPLRADAMFDHATEFELLAYNSGIFYTFDYLYENGKLDPSVLGLVHRIHEAVEAMLDEHPSLDDPHSYAALATMPGDCPETLLEKAGVVPEEGSIFCGIYNGCAVYSKGSRLRSGACDIIGGVAFYLDSAAFTVYKLYEDVGVYSLEEAFNLEYLSHENLRSIAARHYSSYYPSFPETLGIGALAEPDINAITEAWAAWRDGDPARWFNVDDLSTRHFGIRYYGSYPSAVSGTSGDYVILYVPKTYSGGKVIEASYYAYRYGSFHSFDSLIKRGILDASVKVKVETCHKELEAWILSQENLDDPNWFGGQELPPLTGWPEDFSPRKGYKYCGTYNGCVVYQADYNAQLRYDEIYRIGGVDFVVGTKALYVYKDGETMYIWDAFNRGLLNAEELRAIAYYCYGDYAFLN